MELGELVSFYRRRAGLTIDELADKSGVPKSTINKIIGGTTKAPTLENVKAIAKALGVRLADFDSEPELADMFSITEQDIIKKYRLLDPYGKEAVDGVLDVEWRRCAELSQTASARKPDETVYYITSWFYHPMSAGTGEQAGDEQPENLRLIKEPPRGTSYVAPINGNSMEPTYHSGDKLFIHACEEIEPGQIGVFFMDGQQWVKELGDGVLISHNPNYLPRPMTEDIRCQGLVLGVCDESYFE